MKNIQISNPEVKQLLETIGAKFPQEILYEYNDATHIIKLDEKIMSNKSFRTLVYESKIRQKLSEQQESIIFISPAQKGNYFTTKAITIPYKPKEKSRLETAVEAFEAFIKTKSATNTSFSK